MSGLRHGPPLAMNGYMDKEGRKFHARKTRYFKLKDSALYNHRRKDSAPTWGVSLIDSRVAVGHRSEVILQLFDGTKILLFPHSRSECDRWVDLLQRASKRKIGNYYGLTGLVGMGSFAEVRIGYDKSSGQQVAIKVMKKNKKDTELMRAVECEMNFISKNIDHTNIVATYDVFDTRDNLFIVMEYMPGGMLFDIISNENRFSEKNAAEVMRDLLHAVHCLHENDIVHRDIKPENVLALNKTWPLKVKLADFGLADFVLENSFGEKSTCGMYGTPFFVAPEVIRAETYTPAVDIWSLGVLAYNMLSGTLPFDGNNIREVLQRVRAAHFTFPNSKWYGISDEAKDFIRSLLEPDPKKRPTAPQALQHTWLTSSTTSERAIMNDRSALSYEQRKLRMSSIAIDNVADLLRLDDEDEVAADDHGIRALSRLFPGKSNKSSRSSGSGRSRHISDSGRARRGETPDKERHRRNNSRHHSHHDSNTTVSNAAPLQLLPEVERTMSEVSNGSYQYNAPSEMPQWDGISDHIRDPARHVRRSGGVWNSIEGESNDRGSASNANGIQPGSNSSSGPDPSTNQNRERPGVPAGVYRGGLEANDRFFESAGDNFALPAILSVKDIMRRRQEALAGEPSQTPTLNRRRRHGEDSDSEGGE